MGKPDETSLHPAFIHGSHLWINTKKALYYLRDIAGLTKLLVCPATWLCRCAAIIRPVHSTRVSASPTIGSHRIHCLIGCPIRRTVGVLILAGIALLHGPILLRWIRAVRCAIRCSRR